MLPSNWQHLYYVLSLAWCHRAFLVHFQDVWVSEQTGLCYSESLVYFAARKCLSSPPLGETFSVGSLVAKVVPNRPMMSSISVCSWKTIAQRQQLQREG
jgi:hypothetical protein